MKEKKVVKEKTDKQYWRPKIWHAVVVLILVTIFVLFKVINHYPLNKDLQHPANYFGVTFSTKFCEEIGLNWREVYGAILDELQVKNIRVPIYWDELEKEEGVFDFTNYDYLLSEGEKRDVNFIIAIGRRMPRWPECHSPAWLNKKDELGIKIATFKMLREVVNHYKDRESIKYWQIENEPFLGTFGVCPPLDENFLKQEFDLVSSLDDRPLIITGSGELSLWREESKIGDIFGITMYRVVYNSLFGFIRYPLPTSFYHWKARLNKLSVDKVMILELQAEPWVPKGNMIYLSQDLINKTMSIRQFRANIQYAINLDLQQAYFWGVEWWYWQKKYGNPEYWQIAASLFD